MHDIIAAIDEVTGCQHCRKPLAESPSDDFCSEICQTAWRSKQADVALWLPARTGVLRVDYLLASVALASARTPEARAAAEERIQQLHQFVLETFASATQALAPVFRAVTEAFKTAAESTVVFANAFQKADAAPSVQERALQLRQQRSTGPAARTRPPRRIDATRGR